MSSFLQLEDYLLPAPLPACIAVLMCLGLKYLGARLVQSLRHSLPEPLESSAGFIFTAGLVAMLVYLAAFLGIAYLWPLRILAWGIAAFGLAYLGRFKPDCWIPAFHRFKNFFQRQPPIAKTGVLLMIVTGAGLLLASLGPPTDADSLDYHLGIPLDILRHHQAYPRPDWLHARAAGLGESLNLLGLAGGTDILGASLQFFGLMAILTSFLSLVRSDLDRILTAMIVLGCPILLFLVPNQKPQLFPLAGTTLALILIVKRFRSIDPVTIVLAFGSVCFAMSCKYAFILSGAIVIGVGLVAAYKNHRLGAAIGIALAGLLFFLFPNFLQKYLFYGDPVTPFLEPFLAQKQASVMAFSSLLKNYRDSSVVFPLSLILPGSMGTINTTLGAGCFLLFAATKVRGDSRIFIVGALVAGLLTYGSGQALSRYYFESYLWLTAAVIATPAFKVSAVFFKLMVAQMASMAVMASVAAAILFPGAWTASLRDKVMLKRAYQYGETKWLNSFLPKDSVMLTDLRSKALVPRKFVSSEMIEYSLRANDTRVLEKAGPLLKQNKVDIWVTIDNVAPDLFYTKHFPELIGKSQDFRIATRNPWNALTKSRVAVYGSAQ